MKADEVTIPDDVDETVRRAARTMPAQVWDLRAVRARAGRRRSARRLHRKVVGIVAGLVAAAVAATSATVVVVVGTGGSSTAPVSDLHLTVFAADPTHLYAVWNDCAIPTCATAVLGSDDDGATWTERTDWTTPGFRTTMGPGGSLFAEGLRPGPDGRPAKGQADIESTAVSIDGGLTWKSVVDDPRPWPVAPTGIIGCVSAGETGPTAATEGGGCTLSVTDPQTGRRSPLPQQPPGPQDGPWFMVRGTLWVDGLRGGSLDTSLSDDGGRTWAKHPRSCPKTDCDYPLTPGLDPFTAYRVGATSVNGHTVIERSTDAGVHWASFDITGSPGRSSFQSLVRPDGGLVVVQFGDGPTRGWTLGPSDPQPRPVTLSGLPDHIGPTPVSVFSGDADTGYLFYTGDANTVYRSLDGLTWQPIQVPRL